MPVKVAGHQYGFPTSHVVWKWEFWPTHFFFSGTEDYMKGFVVIVAAYNFSLYNLMFGMRVESRKTLLYLFEQISYTMVIQ